MGCFIHCLCFFFFFFFFFKQKTAYEMHISDWSSDVCSSDLAPHPAPCASLLPPGGQVRCQSISPCHEPRPPPGPLTVQREALRQDVRRLAARFRTNLFPALPQVPPGTRHTPEDSPQRLNRGFPQSKRLWRGRPSDRRQRAYRHPIPWRAPSHREEQIGRAHV